MPIDFTLPDDEGATVAFDQAMRERCIPLLFFYRGHW